MPVILQKRKFDAISLARVEALRIARPENGVNVHDIYNAMENLMKKKCTKTEIQMLLEKNQFPGIKVIKMGNGYYTFEDAKHEDSSGGSESSRNEDETKIKKRNGTSQKKSNEKVVVRERSERKRVQKVVFDPSEQKAEKKKKTGNDTTICCALCEDELGLTALANDCSSCLECGIRVHKSCVSSASNWGIVRWRCENCKFCSVCRQKNTSKTENMIVCSVCNDSFHLRCVNVKRSKSKKEWCCETCTRVFNPEDAATPSSSSASSSSSVSSTPEKKEIKTTLKTRRVSRDVKKETKAVVKIEKSEEEIPDCSDWTTQQVHSYFMVYTSSQDAQVFLDQEVDGKILTLLNRYDVLTRFNMKIGPALKLYGLVKRLQERNADIRICWP